MARATLILDTAEVKEAIEYYVRNMLGWRIEGGTTLAYKAGYHDQRDGDSPDQYTATLVIVGKD